MISIAKADRKHVVIVGCGFAGLKLARTVHNSKYQIIKIEKNNMHQFQSSVQIFGHIAWYVWAYVNIMTRIGVKNNVPAFLYWYWNYMTFDPPLRMITKHKRHNYKINPLNN